MHGPSLPPQILGDGPPSPPRSPPMDTVSLELLWSRASKTVSHEGADLEVDTLANGKPVLEFLMK